MIAALKSAYQSFRGVGKASLAIPPLDGAYYPNRAIEDAPVIAEAAQPDNIVLVGDVVHFSDGSQRIALVEGGAKPVATYPGKVTAMAGRGETIAVAVRGAGILLEGGPFDGRRFSIAEAADITALCFEAEGTLLAAIGSRRHNTDAWGHDYLEFGRTGFVCRLDLTSGKFTPLAENLGYPSGLAVAADGAVILSETWKHRLLCIGRDGKVGEFARNLPGYPTRIVAAQDGGFWLAVSAPRNQLLEFIMTEDELRHRMMAEIDPVNWLSPQLAAPTSFLQPMQQGAQRVLGIVKPWAPGLSYGMVAYLDAGGNPTGSFHSRSDGRRHGVTSVAERGGDLLVSSIGGGVVVAIPSEIN